MNTSKKDFDSKNIKTSANSSRKCLFLEILVMMYEVMKSYFWLNIKILSQNIDFL